MDILLRLSVVLTIAALGVVVVLGADGLSFEPADRNKRQKVFGILLTVLFFLFIVSSFLFVCVAIVFWIFTGNGILE